MKKIILIFILFSASLSAQLRQDTSKNIHYLIIPALFRAPETGWAYGASSSVAFKTTHRKDTLTRTSQIQAFAIFTDKGQNIQSLDATIYLPKEQYIFYFSSSHIYFPDRFWGIGAATKNDWSESYVYEQFNLFSHLKRKVAKNIFIGLLFDYQNVFKINYSPGGNFDTTTFFGKKPYTVSGLGMSVGYDTRNNAFWPTKGIFIQSYFNAYTKASGSYYDFYKWIIDVRYFKELFKGHVLATQLYSYNTFGETPMRNFANLGGDGNLRGFYRGRFRDNNMLTLITEYRAHIIWRLSACAFGGIGNVYNTFSDLQKNDLKYSFGGGLRLSLLEKEKLNIRVDYGYYDKYNSGFYFTIGECF